MLTEQYRLETYSILLNIFFKHNKRWTVLSFGQNVQQRLYWLNCFVFWSKFYKKTIWIGWFKPYCLLVKKFFKDNMGWTVLSFGQNFSEKTIWVEPYFPLVKIFLKDNMGWTVLSFIGDFLKREYRLNHIFWLKLS